MIEESLRRAAQDATWEAHHAVPRCLLGLRDRADGHHGLDGEAIQNWLEYEFEALRWGVDPDVSREQLAVLVEASTVDLGRDEHREIHAVDFARCGGAVIAASIAPTAHPLTPIVFSLAFTAATKGRYYEPAHASAKYT